MNKNPLVDLPIPVEDILAGVDAVIVTHLHMDHWDPTAIKLINKQLPIYSQNKEDAEHLRQQGFQRVYALEEQTYFEDISLTYVEGRHASNDAMLAIAGQTCGVIFEHQNEPTTYLLGDTVWYENVEKTLKTYQPQVAIINAGNNQFSEGGPLIMGAEGILKVHQTVPNAKLFATHMEAVNHSFLSRQELHDFALQKNFLKQLAIPADGEEINYN